MKSTKTTAVGRNKSRGRIFADVVRGTRTFRPKRIRPKWRMDDENRLRVARRENYKNILITTKTVVVGNRSALGTHTHTHNRTAKRTFSRNAEGITIRTSEKNKKKKKNTADAFRAKTRAFRFPFYCVRQLLILQNIFAPLYLFFFFSP